MKLLYVTNARIPTEKAHGLQIVKMCEAFQRQGIHTQLIVPFRLQSPEMEGVTDIWSYYDIQTPFQLTRLPALDFIRFENIVPKQAMTWLYYLQCSLFSLLAVLSTLRKQADAYYSRDWQTILVLCLTQWLHRKRVYFEAHEFHDMTGAQWRVRVFRWMLRRIDGLIVITRGLRTSYLYLGIEASRILVAPDGIDANRLSFHPEQREARRKLHIPLDRKIVCYTGHLFPWKGVYTLALSGAYLPEGHDIYIVGGATSDIEALTRFVTERELQNVTITGYVPYTEVPWFLGAADALVLPNSAKAAISREYTSPLKLFEYMGAQRPIVASDLPSIREVLRHNENAVLVPPDEPARLAEGILTVLQDAVLAEKVSQTAYHEVQQYTWDVRAQHIDTFLKNK